MAGWAIGLGNALSEGARSFRMEGERLEERRKAEARQKRVEGIENERLDFERTQRDDYMTNRQAIMDMALDAADGWFNAKITDRLASFLPQDQADPAGSDLPAALPVPGALPAAPVAPKSTVPAPAQTGLVKGPTASLQNVFEKGKANGAKGKGLGEKVVVSGDVTKVSPGMIQNWAITARQELSKLASVEANLKARFASEMGRLKQRHGEGTQAFEKAKAAYFTKLQETPEYKSLVDGEQNIGGFIGMGQKAEAGMKMAKAIMSGDKAALVELGFENPQFHVGRDGTRGLMTPFGPMGMRSTIAYSQWMKGLGTDKAFYEALEADLKHYTDLQKSQDGTNRTYISAAGDNEDKFMVRAVNQAKARLRAGLIRPDQYDATVADIHLQLITTNGDPAKAENNRERTAALRDAMSEKAINTYVNQASPLVKGVRMSPDKAGVVRAVEGAKSIVRGQGGTEEEANRTGNLVLQRLQTKHKINPDEWMSIKEQIEGGSGSPRPERHGPSRAQR